MCGLTECKGGEVSDTVWHEGERGRPTVGPGRGDTESGDVRQGKIGGSSFMAVLGQLRKKGERAWGERKEVGPASNEQCQF
jgi:hypothetical protein